MEALPHIDLDSLLAGDAVDDEVFDVLAAANRQKKRRSSIMTYTGKNSLVKVPEVEEVEDKENVVANVNTVTAEEELVDTIEKLNINDSDIVIEEDVVVASEVVEFAVNETIKEAQDEAAEVKEELVALDDSAVVVASDLPSVKKATSPRKVKSPAKRVKRSTAVPSSVIKIATTASCHSLPARCASVDTGLLKQSKSVILSTARQTKASSSAVNLFASMREKKAAIKSSTQFLSTEDREMFEIANVKKDLKYRLLKAKKTFERIKVKSVSATNNHVRSTKELTIPTTPISHLSKRLGVKLIVQEKEVKEPREVKSSIVVGPTVPEPFTFATDKRVKDSVATVEATKPKTVAKASSGTAHKLTMPTAPLFSKVHDRPKPLSSDEVLRLEMEKLQKQPFKARPVDKRIFTSMGEMGVPKVESRAVTEPLPFDFRVDKRIPLKLPTEATEAAGHSPSKLKDWEPKITMPMSPKLHGGARASSAPARRQRPNHTEVERQKQIAAFAERHVKSSPPKLTQPKEFALKTSERFNLQKSLQEQRLKQEAENEKKCRDFVAKPAPASTIAPRAVTCPVTERKVTQVEEFNLRSALRHEFEVKRQQAILCREEMAAKEQATFKAKPAPGFDRIVVPERAPAPLVQPKEVKLESELRAAKRKDFDEHNKARIADMQRQKIEEAQRISSEEDEKLRQLRRKTIDEGGFKFKAKEICYKDAYPTKPSLKAALTVPKSPYLKTKIRASISQN